MMGTTEEVQLTVRDANGKLRRWPATLGYDKGRIWFLESPFALKDEIKVMQGSKWHGNDEDNPLKMWSIEDCPRNRFQLSFLKGEDAYEWFDRDLKEHEFRQMYHRSIAKPIMPHQCDLANHGLTYHYQIWAAEMGVGKTLSAQLVIENSKLPLWYWVGPLRSLPNIQREFDQWGFESDLHPVVFISYEQLVKKMDEWSEADVVPQGVIFDESSRLKGDTSQRTKAAQMLADKIREKYWLDGYVIEMSGTPSPKSPLDWWSQTEIAWPGFLREGSRKALERRLAFVVLKQFHSGAAYTRTGWKDDSNKCSECGGYEADKQHDLARDDVEPEEYHAFKPSFNEVAYMYDRLKGLVVIKHKKDCLTLPEKRYRKIICKPSPSILRVAKAIAESAPNTITGLTLLRELSDGFQYRDVADGTTKCNHCENGTVQEWYSETSDMSFRAIDMLDEDFVSRLTKRDVECPQCGGSGQMPKYVRITKEIPCPKDKALRMLLDECEETGRIVIFAGFTGSVDRVVNLCHKENWHVVRCDGRGFEVSDPENKIITEDGRASLDFWSDKDNPRVAFVAHPESGGMSLTLVEARKAVYWSNSFKPEYRSQSEDRIHRKGMDENLGCEIVDLVHLPTDARVLEVIQENRKLELMTMGEFSSSLDVDGDESGTLIEEVE
jgi:hypothetical protein